MSEETLAQKALLLERYDEQQYLKQSFDNARAQIQNVQNVQNEQMKETVNDIANTITDNTATSYNVEMQAVTSVKPAEPVKTQQSNYLWTGVWVIGILLVGAIGYTLINTLIQHLSQKMAYKKLRATLQHRKSLLKTPATPYDCCLAYNQISS